MFQTSRHDRGEATTAPKLHVVLAHSITPHARDGGTHALCIDITCTTLARLLPCLLTSQPMREMIDISTKLL